MRPVGVPSVGSPGHGFHAGRRRSPQFLRTLGAAVLIAVSWAAAGCTHILFVTPPESVPPRAVQIPLSVRIELPELSNQSVYTGEGDFDRDSVKRALVAYTVQRGTFRQVVEGRADVTLNFNVRYSFAEAGGNLALYLALEGYVTGGGVHLHRFAAGAKQLVLDTGLPAPEENQAAGGRALKQALDGLFKQIETDHEVLLLAALGQVAPQTAAESKRAAAAAVAEAPRRVARPALALAPTGPVSAGSTAVAPPAALPKTGASGTSVVASNPLASAAAGTPPKTLAAMPAAPPPGSLTPPPSASLPTGVVETRASVPVPTTGSPAGPSDAAVQPSVAPPAPGPSAQADAPDPVAPVMQSVSAGPAVPVDPGPDTPHSVEPPPSPEPIPQGAETNAGEAGMGAPAPPLIVASLPPPASPAPMGSAVLPLAGSDVDRLPATRGRLRGDAYALVIGVEKYAGAVPRAEFAAADAALMRDYLTTTLGYPEDHVLTLLDEQATRVELTRAVERWLPEKAKKDGTVLVYFAGHGTAHAKTREAYLLPSDGAPGTAAKSGYAIKRLYQTLGALPAREVMVVLDACFGGVGGRSVSAGKPVPGVIVSDPNVAKGKVVVLTAGRGAEGCNTSREQRHGLLTYFFLKGLRGEADKNQDGTIRLAEQFEYVKRQVQEVAKRELHTEQTPQLMGSRKMLAKGVNLVEPAGP